MEDDSDPEPESELEELVPVFVKLYQKSAIPLSVELVVGTIVKYTLLDLEMEK